MLNRPPYRKPRCSWLLDFDLLIVSAYLAEWETARILAAAGKTPALVLTELTLADDLLDKVERILEPTRFRPVLVSRTDPTLLPRDAP
jgi:uncharacterized protein YcbX